MSRTKPIDERRVFLAARRVRPERRAAFVARVCRENAALRARVEELLAALEQKTGLGTPDARARLLDRDGLGSGAASASPWARVERQPPLERDRRLAGRYRVHSMLGEGASGRVYRATDELLDAPVAVKVLESAVGRDLDQLRREAATLRWLRVPGVVSLVDDGVDADQRYIVTEIVDGAPFPGAAPRRDWESVRETAVALLETLARIHALGVIHGDLKPANVLVDARGVPTVLDVGVASGPAIDPVDSLFDSIGGTPSYMAPERAGGARPTVASDLYAVGVMIFQALCGEVPHHASSRTELFERRSLEPAPPIRSRASGLPADAARMVDALLARDPAARPASAYDALDLLEHRRHARPGSPDYPWLGSRELIGALMAAAREGRSAAVWGPPGSGKSRTLREAAREAQACGLRVVWVSQTAEPFGGVTGALGVSASWDGRTLEEVRLEVEGRLASTLASGVVVVADAAESLDPWSVAALRAASPAGTVWLASREPSPSARQMPACEPRELEAVVAGPSRIFHVPEDAAAELHRRSSGLVGVALEEAASWVRAGLATWEGHRLALTRESLDQILVAPWVCARSTKALDSREPLDPAALDVVRLVEVLGGRARRAAISAAVGVDEVRLESLVALLRSRGLVSEDAEGRLLCTARTTHLADLGASERARLHRAAASMLPDEDPTRVAHLLAAGGQESSPDEAAACLRSVARSAGMSRAVPMVDAALRALARSGSSATLESLAECVLTVALRSGAARDIDRIRALVERLSPPGSELGAVSSILRAALRALGPEPGTAVDLIASLAPSLSPRLRLQAESVRILAARRTSPEAEASALRAISEWASAGYDASVDAALSGWTGWLRYRQSRFDEAAALHLRAASLIPPGDLRRLVKQLDAAEAILETADSATALRLGEEVREAARSARASHLEARAWVVVESARYRLLDPQDPDPETVAAIAGLRMPALAGRASLVAAAAAWRRGDRARAAERTLCAQDHLRRAGGAEVAALAGAFAAFLRREPDATLCRSALAGDDRRIRPVLALQTLALGSAYDAALRAESRAAASTELVPLLAAGDRRLRREILSVAESLAILDAGESPNPSEAAWDNDARPAASSPTDPASSQRPIA